MGVGRVEVKLAGFVGYGAKSVLGLALCVGTAWGQGDPAKVSPVTPPPPVVSGQGAPDKIMTRAQTAELFASVDTVLAFASKDSGLPNTEKVKRRLLSRDEVSKYLVKNFNEDESAKRLQRSEIVLKKFGLLNRDFDLRPFLLSLLTEQIAGFYDAKTKTVNLLNWVDPDEQRPVLAHELTHALQDQKVGLEKWSSNGFHGVSKSTSEDNARVQTDELETARQAVTEGQAMVVFVDYTIKDTGKTLKDAPELGDTIRESAGDASNSPLMSRAPLLLQRSLLFPYADGLAFEQAVLVKNGRDDAFAGMLASPPGSSWEIMHPKLFLNHAVVPVLRMPDVHAVLDADYEPYDVGVMGALDVEILGSLFGGRELGQALAQEWDGGVYYAGQRRAASVTEKTTAASIGLIYFSRWKSEEAARTFLRVYGEQLPRKYAQVSERKGDEQVDEQVFTSGEGDVVLSISGSTVFVSEGLAQAQARKLHTAFLAVQSSGPVRMAAGSELSLSLAGRLAGFGVVKAALPAVMAQRYTLVR